LLQGETWTDEVDALLEADETQLDEDECSTTENKVPSVDGFEDHALYRSAFALTVWIDQLFDEQASLQNEPAAVKLATHSALASAKLAAALSDDDVDEIGMTIVARHIHMHILIDRDNRPLGKIIGREYAP